MLQRGENHPSVQKIEIPKSRGCEGGREGGGKEEGKGRSRGNRGRRGEKGEKEKRASNSTKVRKGEGGVL